MIATQSTTQHPLEGYGLKPDDISRITDPSKRHDFVLLFDVSHGNPNGDPDAGNLPRVDPETMHGLVTDVAIKRKVRDYLATTRGEPIFIQSEHALNTLYFRAFKEKGGPSLEFQVEEDEELLEWLAENAEEPFDIDPETRTITYLGEEKKANGIQRALIGDKEVGKSLTAKLAKVAAGLASAAKATTRPSRSVREDTKKLLCERYYDIRVFGAVLTGGTNAGQVRGPLQVTVARSIDPVVSLNTTITRCAITREADRQRKETEIGRKPIVLYGLYRAHGFFNPYLAEQTGASVRDLTLFWEALCNMFQYDRSASRGEMAMRGVYIFTHDSKLGNAHAHRLFERVRVRRAAGREAPREFADYVVEVDEKELPEGVTLKRLEC